MDWQTTLAGWTGNAVLAGLVLGCAGADPGGGEPPAPRSGAAVVITEIQGGHLSRRPRFISLAPQLAREGEPYLYGVSALEQGGEEVHLTLMRAPEGATLAGAVLQWTPEHAQAGRPQRFTLRAMDEHGIAEEQTWTVIPRPEPGGILAGPRGHH